MTWDQAIARLKSSDDLREALRTLTIREADDRLYTGRMLVADHDAFETIWTWTAVRYAGAAGRLQERYYCEHGPDAYQDMLGRRRDQVERIIGVDVPC